MPYSYTGTTCISFPNFYDYTVLKIDTHKIKGGIKVFQDPYSPEQRVCYTYDNIPPYAISVDEHQYHLERIKKKEQLCNAITQHATQYNQNYNANLHVESDRWGKTLLDGDINGFQFNLEIYYSIFNNYKIEGNITSPKGRTTRTPWDGITCKTEKDVIKKLKQLLDRRLKKA